MGNSPEIIHFETDNGK